jgi:Reverse transcriptase (RNA-dependent DNA polymerase).
MVIDPKCSEILVSIAPEYKKYLRPDSTIYLRIRKALYGLPQAALLWYQHLTRTLTSAGYTSIASDHCVYVKQRGDKKSTICLHVDDLFHSYTNSQRNSNAISSRLLYRFLRSLSHFYCLTGTSGRRGSVT